MKDFFAELMEKASDIVIDEMMIRPSSDYVPTNIIGRNEQMSEIVPTLNVVERNQAPRHLFLMGPNGTGKTVTIKYILRRLHDYAEFKDIYIVGSTTATPYTVLKELAEEGGFLRTDKDISLDDMRRMVSDMLRTMRIPTIIILDECDYFKPEVFETVLQALIGNDQAEAPHVCVISIANSVRLISGMQDSKVVSRYVPRNVEFPPYNEDELLKILRDREGAFYPGVVDDTVFIECSVYAFRYKNGDARYALDLLSESADLARIHGMKKLQLKCVKAAEEKLEVDYSLRPIEKLGDKMLDVFLVIAREPEQKIKNAFALYNTTMNRLHQKPVKSPTFSTYLSALERRGLIERERRGKEGKPGNDWFVKVSDDIDRKEILKAYDVTSLNIRR